MQLFHVEQCDSGQCSTGTSAWAEAMCGGRRREAADAGADLAHLSRSAPANGLARLGPAVIRAGAAGRARLAAHFHDRPWSCPVCPCGWRRPAARLGHLTVHDVHVHGRVRGQVQQRQRADVGPRWSGPARSPGSAGLGQLEPLDGEGLDGRHLGDEIARRVGVIRHVRRHAHTAG